MTVAKRLVDRAVAIFRRDASIDLDAAFAAACQQVPHAPASRALAEGMLAAMDVKRGKPCPLLAKRFPIHAKRGAP